MGERPALTQEQVRGASVRPERAFPQPRPQSAQFVALYRLVRREAALLPPHVEAGGVEVYILEPQVDQLRDSQAVAVSHQQHEVIA